MEQWDPAGKEKGGASLYGSLLKSVKYAGGKVRGILWYQGESDCGPAEAPTYGDRFVSAVRAWREALACPGLHVLTVQLNRYMVAPEADPDRDWTIVREAQRRVPQRLAGVTVVPAMDLPLSDAIHNSAHGNLLLADRAAQAALATVYGQKLDWAAPEPVSARRDAGADGAARQVVIAFRNVASRLDTLDATAVPFRVEDEGGIVPIEAVQYPGGAKAGLRLARALAGRAVVHGCYGRNPSPPPYDMVRMMPMLGFHGLAIE